MCQRGKFPILFDLISNRSVWERWWMHSGGIFFFLGGGGKGSRSLPITSLSTRLLVVNRFLSVEKLINTWIHLQFSCHKEPEKFSWVQLSETSICRWSLLLLRSFWFPGKSPQAAQEWNREELEEKSNYYHSTPSKQDFMFVLGTKTLILRATWLKAIREVMWHNSLKL